MEGWSGGSGEAVSSIGPGLATVVFCGTLELVELNESEETLGAEDVVVVVGGWSEDICIASVATEGLFEG